MTPPAADPAFASPASVSLVVTTYNWPRALALALASARLQTRLPDEVIVADDGSGPGTRQLVCMVAAGFPVPLRHVWQVDEGFRAARSRNLAITAARGEYVLLLDGDMVMHPRFVADHLSAARRGSFVQGSRVLVAEDFSARMLAQPGLRPVFSSGGVKRRGSPVTADMRSARNTRMPSLRSHHATRYHAPRDQATPSGCTLRSPSCSLEALR